MVRILFIDYSKTFDHIDHSVVLNKIKLVGGHDLISHWVSAFLSERQQRVKLGKCLSEWLPVQGSVSQGSWLGPLLFLIMISDMQPPNDTYKYMDDTTTYGHKNEVMWHVTWSMTCNPPMIPTNIWMAPQHMDINMRSCDTWHHDNVNSTVKIHIRAYWDKC